VVRVLVISPVGTSLFRNFSRSPRFSGVAARYGVGSWGELPIDDPRNAYPGGEVCGYLREEPLIEALLEFAGSDPRASCAENCDTVVVTLGSLIDLGNGPSRERNACYTCSESYKHLLRSTPKSYAELRGTVERLVLFD
jgi:hypothetical protein